MSGHFPFMGRGGRAETNAFYELHGFNETLQEEYYRWWYEWAKEKVVNDPDLYQAKAVEFNNYPYGQHAQHNFHLNDKAWAMALADLGAFIKYSILPKLSEEELHKLEQDHDKMLAELKKKAEENPREPVPEVGHFRHT